MKTAKQTVRGATEESLDGVDILAVERATEEFRAHLRTVEPGIEYIRRLVGPKAAQVHHVLYRYVELMRIARPQLSFKEAALLVDVLNSGRTLFFQPPNELKEYIATEVEDWLGLYGDFKGCTVDCDTFAKKLRLLSAAELCSLVDSIDQWGNSSKRSLSPSGLAPYFNLNSERGVSCRG